MAGISPEDYIAYRYTDTDGNSGGLIAITVSDQVVLRSTGFATGISTFSKNKQEAFDTYIGQGRPAYVKREKLTLEEAVGLILGSGGVPILAHPGLLKDLSILPRLIQAGLVGMEVIHHSHSAEQTDYFSQMAKDHALLPSGGSDCHGPGGKDELYIGRYSIPWSWLEDLRAARNNRIL